MTVALGGVRDLIEAGLSEGADAATVYGISAASPVPGERLGRCDAALLDEDEPATPGSSEAIDAPGGIFDRLRNNACAVGVDQQD